MVQRRGSRCSTPAQRFVAAPECDVTKPPSVRYARGKANERWNWRSVRRFRWPGTSRSFVPAGDLVKSPKTRFGLRETEASPRVEQCGPRDRGRSGFGHAILRTLAWRARTPDVCLVCLRTSETSLSGHT